MTTPSTARGAGVGVPGGADAGLLRRYGKGVFTCVFGYPRDSSPRVQQQGKAAWRVPKQRLGEPHATDTCQPPRRDPRRGPAARSVLPGAAAGPSKAPSPSPGCAGAGCGPRCSCSSPRSGFSHPDIALCSKPPLFQAGPPVGNIFCLLLFSSDRTHSHAFPARAKLRSFSPTLGRLRGTLPALPRGQLAKRSALPWPNRKGLGSRSPARVPGAGRSCLASILSRYKTRFQESETFHWQEMEAARDGQLPQLQFPARPRSQPCSLHVLWTHTSRMRCPDPWSTPTGGLHPRGPHRSPEATGTAAKPLVPASIRSRIAPPGQGARLERPRAFSFKHYVIQQRQPGGRTRQPLLMLTPLPQPGGLRALGFLG